jgi:hypothetical protein
MEQRDLARAKEKSGPAPPAGPEADTDRKLTSGTVMLTPHVAGFGRIGRAMKSRQQNRRREPKSRPAAKKSCASKSSQAPVLRYSNWAACSWRKKKKIKVKLASEKSRTRAAARAPPAAPTEQHSARACHTKITTLNQDWLMYFLLHLIIRIKFSHVTLILI